MRANFAQQNNKTIDRRLDSFKREYLGEIEPSEREKVLYQFALDYERSCESFDQLVCQYKNERGIAMPVTTDEMASISKNAKSVFSSLLLKANEKLFNLNKNEFTPVTAAEFVSFIHLAQRNEK